MPVFVCLGVLCTLSSTACSACGYLHFSVLQFSSPGNNTFNCSRRKQSQQPNYPKWLREGILRVIRDCLWHAAFLNSGPEVMGWEGRAPFSLESFGILALPWPSSKGWKGSIGTGMKSLPSWCYHSYCSSSLLLSLLLVWGILGWGIRRWGGDWQSVLAFYNPWNSVETAFHWNSLCA